jgi:hypothetical protein
MITIATIKQIKVSINAPSPNESSIIKNVSFEVLFMDLD